MFLEVVEQEILACGWHGTLQHHAFVCQRSKGSKQASLIAV